MLDALWGGLAVVTRENGRVWAHSRVGDASARRPSILADRAARVAIDMALLTELFASPPPPVRRVKDACKVQLGRAHAAVSRLCRPQPRLAFGST